eukprot:gene944-4197_t
MSDRNAFGRRRRQINRKTKLVVTFDENARNKRKKERQEKARKEAEEHVQQARREAKKEKRAARETQLRKLEAIPEVFVNPAWQASKEKLDHFDTEEKSVSVHVSSLELIQAPPSDFSEEPHNHTKLSSTEQKSTSKSPSLQKSSGKQISDEENDEDHSENKLLPRDDTTSTVEFLSKTTKPKHNCKKRTFKINKKASHGRDNFGRKGDRKSRGRSSSDTKHAKNRAHGQVRNVSTLRAAKSRRGSGLRKGR